MLDSPASLPAVVPEEPSAFSGLSWPPTEADLASIEIVSMGPGDLVPLAPPRREFAVVHGREPGGGAAITDVVTSPVGTDDAVTHNSVMAPFDWLASSTPSGPPADTKHGVPAAPTPSAGPVRVLVPPAHVFVDAPPPEVVHLESSAADVFVAESGVTGVARADEASVVPPPAATEAVLGETVADIAPAAFAAELTRRETVAEAHASSEEADASTLPPVAAAPVIVPEAATAVVDVPVPLAASPASEPDVATAAPAAQASEPLAPVTDAPVAVDASTGHPPAALDAQGATIDEPTLPAASQATVDEVPEPEPDAVADDTTEMPAAVPLPTFAAVSPEEESELARLDAQLSALLALVGRKPEELDAFRDGPAAAAPVLPSYTPPAPKPTSRLAAPSPLVLEEAPPPAVSKPALQLTSLADDLAALAEPIVIPKVVRRPISVPVPEPEPEPLEARAPAAPERDLPLVIDTPATVEAPAPRPEAKPPAAGSAVLREPFARAPEVKAPASKAPATTAPPVKAPTVRTPVAKRKGRKAQEAPVAVPVPPPWRRPIPQASGPWVAAAAVFGVIGAAAFGATHLARWQESWFGGGEPDAGASKEQARQSGAAATVTGPEAGARPVVQPPTFTRQPIETRIDRSGRSSEAESLARVERAATAPVVDSRTSPPPEPAEVVEPARDPDPEVSPEPEPPPAPAPAYVQNDQAGSEGDVSEKVEGQLYQAMALYMRAYAAMDPSAVQRVWPSADPEALARAFEPLKAVRLGIDKCEIVVEGGLATATCPGRAMYLLKEGGPEPQVEQHEWRFTFRRVGQGWRIQDVEVI